MGTPRKTSRRPPQSSKPTRKQTAILLATIADTTWRMFMPIIGLLVLGLWLDKQKFDTTPYLTITGLILGTILTTLLVRSQLRRVKR